MTDRGAGVRLLIAGDCGVEHRVSRSFHGTANGPARHVLLLPQRLAVPLAVGALVAAGLCLDQAFSPTASRALRRAPRYPVAWSCLGLAAALTARFGRAPKWLERRTAR